MDGNQFTGLNPEKARNDIDSFYNATLKITNDMSQAMGAFLSDDVGIKRVWCSPKAVEFSKNYIPRYYRIVAEFVQYTMSTCRNAIRSYNRMARVNGLQPYNGIVQDVLDVLSKASGDNTVATDAVTGNNYLRAAELLESGAASVFYPSHPESGIVGMNITSVQEAINIFTKEVENIIKEFDEIPSDLALYDENNSQQIAYTTNITRLKNCFSSECSNILTALNTAMSEEIFDTRLAYQQSVDTLQVNA